MSLSDVYTDIWGMKAVSYDSNLYKDIWSDRYFKEVQREAEGLGLNPVSAAARTDEQLVYFIAVKRELINE